MYFIPPGCPQPVSPCYPPNAFNLVNQLPPAVRRPTNDTAYWWVSCWNAIANHACSPPTAIHQPGPLKRLPGTLLCTQVTPGHTILIPEMFLGFPPELFDKYLFSCRWPFPSQSHTHTLAHVLLHVLASHLEYQLITCITYQVHARGCIQKYACCYGFSTYLLSWYTPHRQVLWKPLHFPPSQMSYPI